MVYQRILFIGAVPVTLLGVLYYQHRRLEAAYPTLRVPSVLEISARRDAPALGMHGTNDRDKGHEPWLRTHAGDMWAASVPRHHLFPRGTALEADPSLTVFARAFWGTWPLRIERYIVTSLARLGVIFDLRSGGALVDRDGENAFVEKAKILNGLFTVEAHDTVPPVAPLADTGVLHGPLIASWWLRPSPSDNDRVTLLGGYHSFAIEDSAPSGNDTVRLLFVSHLILSPPADAVLPPGPSIPTSALGKILDLRQNTIMHFHTLYSRILLDLAVRSLANEAGTR